MVEFEQAMNHLIPLDNNKKPEYLKGFYQEWRNPSTFFYIEEWEKEANLRKHMRSDGFKAFLGAMKVLGEVVNANIIFTTHIEEL